MIIKPAADEFLQDIRPHKYVTNSQPLAKISKMHSYQVKIITVFEAPSILGNLLAKNMWRFFISFDFFLLFQYIQRRLPNRQHHHIPITATIILQNIIAMHTADVLVSLCSFPPWVSFPWPITMTMGAGYMDTVTRQRAASAAETAVSCQRYGGAAERRSH